MNEFVRGNGTNEVLLDAELDFFYLSVDSYLKTLVVSREVLTGNAHYLVEVPELCSEEPMRIFIFTGDPFSTFDLNSFLSCVYAMRSGGGEESFDRTI